MGRKYSECRPAGRCRRSGVFILSLLCLSMPALSAETDGWNVDGEHGELHVEGLLTEAACSLDMASKYQQIDLGNTSSAALLHQGDEGTPIAFQIHLKDCFRVQSSQHDKQTGNLVWSANQPVVSVAFLAPADVDSPDLAAVDNPTISGVGLRLMDTNYHKIKLGLWERPQFLDPGQDTLTFYAVPERTRSNSFAPGPIEATVNFFLDYE